MFAGKILLVFLIVFVVVSADEEERTSSTKLNGDELKEAEKLLVTSLGKFAAGYGPFYKIGELHFVTKEDTVGKVFKYKADLIDSNSNIKKCEVQIWTRPESETGVEVTFKCEGPVVAHA